MRAGVNYVADRFANPGNTVTLPGYTTVDAMAYYRIDLTLNPTHLFDRDYIVAGHGSNDNLNLSGTPHAGQLPARCQF